MNCSLLIPTPDENTKKQSASVAVPGTGLSSRAFGYIAQLVHLLFHDSKLGEK